MDFVRLPGSQKKELKGQYRISCRLECGNLEACTVSCPVDHSTKAVFTAGNVKNSGPHHRGHATLQKTGQTAP